MQGTVVLQLDSKLSVSEFSSKISTDKLSKFICAFQCGKKCTLAAENSPNSTSAFISDYVSSLFG